VENKLRRAQDGPQQILSEAILRSALPAVYTVIFPRSSLLMVRLVEIVGVALNKPISFIKTIPSGFSAQKHVKYTHHSDPMQNTTSNTPSFHMHGTPHATHFDTRLSMHDPVTMALFLVCFSLVGFMFWILTKLPRLSSVETVTERFIWRPTTAAHFKRDRDLLVKYRRAYAWELFVGMTTINIMLVPSRSDSRN
jgi:hypothetical protein